VDAVQFVNKWLHLLSIIGVLGGVLFALVVLKAEKSEASDDTSDVWRLLWKRWGIMQAVFWVVALLTGFANYAFVSPNVIGKYHMFAGMKMTLAILMFVIVLIVAHPMPALASLVKKKSGWLTIVAVLGIVVVGISAYLNIGRVKRTLTKPPVEAEGPKTYNPQFMPDAKP